MQRWELTQRDTASGTCRPLSEASLTWPDRSRVPGGLLASADGDATRDGLSAASVDAAEVPFADSDLGRADRLGCMGLDWLCGDSACCRCALEESLRGGFQAAIGFGLWLPRNTRLDPEDALLPLDALHDPVADHEESFLGMVLTQILDQPGMRDIPRICSRQGVFEAGRDCCLQTASSGWPTRQTPPSQPRARR